MGTEDFQVNVIDNIYELSEAYTEEIAEFKYIGLTIKKNGENIKHKQDAYMKKLKYVYPSVCWFSFSGGQFCSGTFLHI